MELTLSATKKIIQSINAYTGKAMDFESIVKHCNAPAGDVAQVIEFLQELDIKAVPGNKIGTSVQTMSLAERVDMETPMDLASELTYNYQVGKAVLQQILEETTPDKEEIRKTLTTIQKFMDSMLKMQEKVYNVQQMQRFQEAVLDVLQEHQLKDTIVRKMLELPL
jgi:hypothetical protein